METKRINIKEPDALKMTAEILNLGGLVVFPTDTVYGLAAKIDNEAGIERIYAVKGRETTKAIAVLIGHQDQIDLVAEKITSKTRQLIDKFWPGGLTVVVTKKNGLPESLSIYPTVGVRIPDHQFVRDLADLVGPLATSSANLSGQESATNADMAGSDFSGIVELIVDGGQSGNVLSSTVLDCSSDTIKVLREGAISIEDLKPYLS